MRVNETASAMLSRAWQGDVLRGLRATMDEQNQLTIGHTRQARLTGKGPFPVSEGRLGVRTNRLRASLRAAKTRIVGTSIASSIGSNVEYAAAHEFGFRGSVSVKSHMRRQKSRDVFVKQFVNGKLKRVRTVTGAAFVTKGKQKSWVKGDAFVRSVDIPARAPIAHGIEDRRAEYERAMSQSIINTLRGLGYS
jgi:phage gpG-like protein